MAQFAGLDAQSMRKILAVLAPLIMGWLARRKQPWDRLSPNAFIADIYRQIVRLVFVIGGLVIALDIVGATALLSGILGAAGIVGLAIGFAVRDTVENFIASVLLSMRQPFRPNDTIEIVARLVRRITVPVSPLISTVSLGRKGWRIDSMIEAMKFSTVSRTAKPMARPTIPAAPKMPESSAVAPTISSATTKPPITNSRRKICR